MVFHDMVLDGKVLHGSVLDGMLFDGKVLKGSVLDYMVLYAMYQNNTIEWYIIVVDGLILYSMVFDIL